MGIGRLRSRLGNWKCAESVSLWGPKASSCCNARTDPIDPEHWAKGAFVADRMSAGDSRQHDDALWGVSLHARLEVGGGEVGAGLADEEEGTGDEDGGGGFGIYDFRFQI
jgi:hypothetical protein